MVPTSRGPKFPAGTPSGSSARRLSAVAARAGVQTPFVDLGLRLWDLDDLVAKGVRVILARQRRSAFLALNGLDVADVPLVDGEQHPLVPIVPRLAARLAPTPSLRRARRRGWRVRRGRPARVLRGLIEPLQQCADLAAQIGDLTLQLVNFSPTRFVRIGGRMSQHAGRLPWAASPTESFHEADLLLHPVNAYPRASISSSSPGNVSGSSRFPHRMTWCFASG